MAYGGRAAKGLKWSAFRAATGRAVNGRARWAFWMVPVALVAVTLAPGTATPTAAADATAPPGGFTPVTPARILDTRIALGAPAGKVGPQQALELQVTGRGGVPATGVSAVALNVTVTEPTAAGYVTVYPTGATRPVASSLNFVPGQTVPNAVVVKVGSGGRVTLFNSWGTSHLVADVAGWHATERSVGSPFTPVAPVRKLDTRESQPVPGGGTRRLALTQGLPPGTTAVALNVTATEPSTGGYLTIYPAGDQRPTASNLNLVPGQTRANFVAVKVSAGGAIDIFNQSGTTHVVVDLLGYWGPASLSRLSALTPTRILDTRSGLGRPTGPVGPAQTAVLQLPGPTAVPEGMASAVVLNVTATEPTAAGYLTVYPGDVPRPLASNLNFVRGETVPNLVMVPVDEAGRVNIYNSSGQTHVVVDVVGWFDFPSSRFDIDGMDLFGAEVAIDPTSTYAYISNTGRNQVEVLRLADGTFESPILVGSQPMGLDVTPDGSLLYVANRGSVFVSVVDLRTRTELRRFPVPAGSSADHPYQIATLGNGKALLTTTFYGSGFGAAMYEIDLATDAVRPRKDFYHWGTTTQYTSVRASGDRRAAVITAGDISSGPVFRYDADTDTFSGEVDTATFTNSIATDLDGSVTLVNDGGMVFDENLNHAGSVPGCGTNGVAVNRAGTVGYALEHRTGDGFVAVCDLVRFTVRTEIPIGPVKGLGRLAVSPDGTTLVGITDSGVVLVRL
ncbi:MAG: beta-propeller fold lactonase family protein [Actinomycetota bacterium]|nr:beta-propeller fold lactonase family protein [Actinomycetota bacterium]